MLLSKFMKSLLDKLRIFYESDVTISNIFLTEREVQVKRELMKFMKRLDKKNNQWMSTFDQILKRLTREGKRQCSRGLLERLLKFEKINLPYFHQLINKYIKEFQNEMNKTTNLQKAYLRKKKHIQKLHICANMLISKNNFEDDFDPRKALLKLEQQKIIPLQTSF